MLGMICTQYSRHFLVCPRAISTQIEPGTRTGTEATASMACRTVSFVGPSEPLQVSDGGDDCDELGGCDPHPAASTISRIVTS